MVYRHVHILHAALVNLVAAGLALAAYVQGWLGGLFVQHTWMLSAIIFGVFVYGLCLCSIRIWQTNSALSELADDDVASSSRVADYLQLLKAPDRETRDRRLSMLRLRLSNRVGTVRQISNSLVFLGLIGTVIGFIIALSGVDPSAVSQVEKIAPMVSVLISGMSVALYTTLLGAVLNLWLSVNQRILTTGTVNLLSGLVERGESHG